jgi:hypothetical protein
MNSASTITESSGSEGASKETFSVQHIAKSVCTTRYDYLKCMDIDCMNPGCPDSVIFCSNCKIFYKG